MSVPADGSYIERDNVSERTANETIMAASLSFSLSISSLCVAGKALPIYDELAARFNDSNNG